MFLKMFKVKAVRGFIYYSQKLNFLLLINIVVKLKM